MDQDFSSVEDSLKSSGDMIWGMLLLFAGVMLLLNFLEIIPWDFWSHVWRFWPVLIVLSGISILLGNSWLSRFLVIIVSTIIFSLIILVGLKAIGYPFAEILPSELYLLLESWEAIIK